MHIEACICMHLDILQNLMKALSGATKGR